MCIHSLEFVVDIIIKPKEQREINNELDEQNNDKLPVPDLLELWLSAYKCSFIIGDRHQIRTQNIRQK